MARRARDGVEDMGALPRLLPQADVVVLPETSYQTGKKVAALMAGTGRPMQVHTDNGSTPFVAGIYIEEQKEGEIYGSAHWPDLTYTLP